LAHGLGQLGDDLVQVAHDAQIGELEDRRVRILVDGDDVLGVLHADLVLDGARDPRGQVQLRRDRLAGLTDLARIREPSGVDHRAGRGDGPAERLGELLELAEAVGLAEAAAAGDEDVGVLDVHIGAALLAALDHGGLVRPGRVLDVDILDRRAPAAGLAGLEGVEPADDHADVALVARLGDRGVLQDRALGHELAVLGLDVGDLHGHAGVEARGEAGADLEAEQAAPEQRVAVAVVRDDLGHHVDDRLREALGALGAVHLRGAVGTERGTEVVGQVIAPDHHGMGLAAELAGELGALGDGAQGVLVELPVLVKHVNQDICHLAPPSSRRP
jgi:hypothetical protein